MAAPGQPAGPVGFVFGGGGVLGAYEVGMARALLHHGIRPDLVVGTSIGAFNGAAVAAAPDERAAERLTELWSSAQARTVYGDSLPRQLGRFARRTHLHSPAPLRRLLERELGADTTFEDLPVPFHCCAASIERAAEHWFCTGPLIEAVLASSAVPGLLPPVHLGNEHFIDGGIVNSVPVGRAVALGARTVYVMQVGRIERPLRVPRRPWEVAQVAFEVARRHRFARELAEAPPDVAVHVLPTGGGSARDDSPLSYRRIGLARGRIERAYEATRAYLEARD
ncbi:patatin-like phospholipase family protein [Dactylosporangium sp. CA-139066]|uniref:patatin-like phospholipase family protein n=1 Tax=Dactylosporangium sp. CA-139066 TaxID=3239930 RepID=UPI003D8D2371